jgi:methyl acetate hydrolase
MRILTLFLYCLLLVCQVVHGQHNELSFPGQEKVVALMNEAVKKSDLPAVVAIAINNKNEKVTYTYGNAIWREDSKITGENIFRIASMTKLITTIAAMQLVESGLIGLDDSLSLLLPEMCKIPILSNGKLIHPKNKITLRQLLTHTSGFGYPMTDKELATFKDSLWAYKDLPRRFESGSKFLYGTSTYWLGKLVERLSGVSLETYFRNNITGPLGMNRTWFNVPDSLKQYIVSRGARGPDGLQPLTEIPDRIPTNTVTDFRGDGGLFSTPDDYTILLKCLLNYGTLNNKIILKKEIVLEMTKSQIDNISLWDSSAYYDPGLCCNLKGLVSNDSKWGFAGLIESKDEPYGPKAGTISWGGAFNTFFYIDFKSGIAVSIFTQTIPFNHPETMNLFHRFSEIIYGIN